MRVEAIWSHREARELLCDMEMYDSILSAVNSPHVQIGRRMTRTIKSHISNQLLHEGWASRVKVSPNAALVLNLFRNSVIVQIQTGNIARVYYDLMKIQAMYDQDLVLCGALILPIASAARVMGSNMAQAERVANELKHVFNKQVQVPILIVGFA